MKTPLFRLILIATFVPGVGFAETPAVSPSPAVSTATSPAPQNADRAQQHPAGICELCAQAEAFRKSADDDEKKATREFADFLGSLKLSDQADLREQELKALLKTSLFFIDKDERREVPQYLVDIEDEHPVDFKKALAVFSHEDQKKLRDWMDPARKLLEKGEEP